MINQCKSTNLIFLKKNNELSNHANIELSNHASVISFEVKSVDRVLSYGVVFCVDSHVIVM